MLKELKQKLDEQYNDMWTINWKEIIGAPIVAILIFVLAFAFFSTI